MHRKSIYLFFIGEQPSASVEPFAKHLHDLHDNIQQIVLSNNNYKHVKFTQAIIGIFNWR